MEYMCDIRIIHVLYPLKWTPRQFVIDNLLYEEAKRIKRKRDKIYELSKEKYREEDRRVINKKISEGVIP
jgi:hypothetical protein